MVATVTPLEEHEQRQRGHELADLRYHWGEAYVITWQDGRFTAARMDDHRVIPAATAAGLFEALRRDYAEQPVPRTRAQEAAE